MKLIYKLLIAISLVGLSACNVFELDEYLENPNSVAPENAGVDFLYNNIQLSFENFFNSTWSFSGGVSRQIAMTGGFTYSGSYQPQSFNGIWSNAYASILPDIEALLVIAEERDLGIYSGTAKVMEAYVLFTLADLFSDVPLSEALQGTDIIGPKADAGADIYAAAHTLLDEAISELESAQTAAPSVDIFYDGDAASWITLAKTLKLRAYVNARLIDSSAGDKIAALVAEGDLIDDESEDFQFQYSNNRLNPDSRHPFYANSYESTDGDYMNNWYMWLLVNEKDMMDPRTRFYFYRQDGDLTDESSTVFGCVFSIFPDREAAPDHFLAVDPDMPYCIVSEDGYYGRDHGNGSGIPPDGPVRSVYGLYPAGGKFDDNSFDFVQNQGEDGAKGRGIQPIMLSSFTHFLRAEAALTAGTGEDARALLESGIDASMEKVFSFADAVDGSIVVASDPVSGDDITLGQAYLDPLDSLKGDYLDLVLAEYDAAGSDAERLDIVVREYFIAAWGNGLETYNAYRRTGMPSNIQPTLDPGGGDFLRSALYPTDHVTLNPNADQRDPTEPVFWDTNDKSLFR